MAANFAVENFSKEEVKELKIILSKLDNENPVSPTLFKKKFQIMLVDRFLPFQKPVGELFEKAIVICYVKPRDLPELLCKMKLSSCQSKALNDAGCPLPLQFRHFYEDPTRSQLLIKQLNETYHLLPMSGNMGRKFIHFYESIGYESCKDLPIVAISEDDHTKLTFLGSLKQSYSRLTLREKVTKLSGLPSLNSIKAEHLTGYQPFLSIDTSVYARYDFLKFDGARSSALNPVADGRVFMECWWSDASALLEPPICRGCECFAKVKVVDDYTKTEASSLYKDILFIENLQKCLQIGIMSWSSSKCDIMREVKDLINHSLFGEELGKPKISPVKPYIEYWHEAVDRKILDFTEKLWNILKGCSSGQELEDAFSYVYNTLAESSKTPDICPYNMSTLARDIKNMTKESGIRPAMDRAVAIQNLLEIGIEKLRRDYIKYFERLLPIADFAYYMGPDFFSPDAVTCLKKLHSVLELSIIVVKQLRIPELLLCKFVRAALDHYTTVPDIDSAHIFSIQYPIATAQLLLDTMRPTVWEISFVNRKGRVMKQSIHHFTTTPTQDHIYAPRFIRNNTF